MISEVGLTPRPEIWLFVTVTEQVARCDDADSIVGPHVCQWCLLQIQHGLQPRVILADELLCMPNFRPRVPVASCSVRRTRMRGHPLPMARPSQSSQAPNMAYTYIRRRHTYFAHLSLKAKLDAAPQRHVQMKLTKPVQV